MEHGFGDRVGATRSAGVGSRSQAASHVSVRASESHLPRSLSDGISLEVSLFVCLFVYLSVVVVAVRCV